MKLETATKGVLKVLIKVLSCVFWLSFWDRIRGLSGEAWVWEEQ